MNAMLAALLSLSALLAQGPQRPAEPPAPLRAAESAQPQVFVDVKVVTYRSTEPATGHHSLALGVRIFDVAGAAAALKVLRVDETARITQAPKVLTLAGAAAGISIGNDPKAPEIAIHVTPTVLADGRSLTLEVEARIEAAGPVTRSNFVAMRSGETAVLFQGRREDGLETLVFVTPSIVQPEPKVATRRALG